MIKCKTLKTMYFEFNQVKNRKNYQGSQGYTKLKN